MNIVLLSGGSGKRLWPLSNDIRSKQFIKIFKRDDGEYESMVQKVYRQILKVDPDAQVTIATSKSQVSAIHNQLGEDVGISIEPSRRDTFPAIVLATAYLHYVQNNLTHLLNSFLQLFGASLDGTAKGELRTFAQGGKLSESPMHMRILEAFKSLKKQKDSLSQSIKQLNAMVKELEAKPKDISYEEEIKELKAEQAALINVVKEINKKNIFNFLSDEGLLPNYAFPESGIVLKAILYRKEDEAEDTTPKKIYKTKKYSRSKMLKTLKKYDDGCNYSWRFKIKKHKIVKLYIYIEKIIEEETD